MSRRVDEKVRVLINDEVVIVSLHWCPAEPDVGIFHDYSEIMGATMEDGTPVLFTDDEIEAALEAR